MLINTVVGYQKARNVARDHRVAVTLSDAANPSRYYALRGRVIGATTNGGAEHIESLAQRYLGSSYPWYGGRQQERLILTIAADSIHAMG